MNKKAKILLVDDSAFMRNVLKNILHDAGFENFTEATDGVEAIKKIKEESFDVVLLDLIMPNKGGLEVLKEIGAKAKILVISAVGQEKVVEDAKQQGALGYVIKPFDNQQVVAEVKRVLGD